MIAHPLRLKCWEGYDTPALREPFEKRHKLVVHADTLLSDARAAEEIAGMATTPAATC